MYNDHMGTRPIGSPGSVLLWLLIALLLVAGIDIGYIFFSQRCLDTPTWECLAGSEEEPEVQETVTAAATYSIKDYSATVVLTIPLAGGEVTGSVSGDCTGSIKGTYAGGDGGAISGKGKGSCMLIIPASGTFSGTVQYDSKTVPLEGSGSAAGFSGGGSLTLSY